MAGRHTSFVSGLRPGEQVAQPLPGSPVARLRPRTAAQVLDAGFEVLRFRAGTVAALVVVLHGPFLAAAYLLGRAADGLTLWRWLLRQLDLVGTTSASGSADGSIVYAAASALTLLAGEMVVGVAIASLIRAWMEGRDPAAPEILLSTARRLPVILASWLAALASKTLGAALCLVGLLLVVPPLSLAAPVLAFERAGPVNALVRSRTLTSRNSGAALFITLMAPALSLSLFGVLRLGDLMAITAFEQFAQAMAMAVMLVLLVARASASTLLYLDIRVRTEGLDLAMRAPHALGTSR